MKLEDWIKGEIARLEEVLEFAEEHKFLLLYYETATEISALLRVLIWKKKHSDGSKRKPSKSNGP